MKQTRIVQAYERTLVCPLCTDATSAYRPIQPVDLRNYFRVDGLKGHPMRDVKVLVERA